MPAAVSMRLRAVIDERHDHLRIGRTGYPRRARQSVDVMSVKRR